MDREAAYPAARIVSPIVHAYFARKRAETGAAANGRLATLPNTAAIQSIVDAAFWASLRREEGFIPKISLAFLSPEETTSSLLFERPLPLHPAMLTRVAPAVERPGIHLGVWYRAAHNDARDPRNAASQNPDDIPQGITSKLSDDPVASGLSSPNSGDLCVWGATRAIPSLCLVVEVAAPGLIVIKHHSIDTTGKFINVAVLEGDQVKIIDKRAAIPICPGLLTSLLGPESPVSSPTKRVPNVLVQLAVSMRAHGRGGLLLVVPASAEAWRESIVLPIPYAVSPPFSDLAVLARAADDDPRQLKRIVEAVAGLTAVDGAVVLTNQFEVLGFGAKITRRRGRYPVEQVILTEPIEGDQAVLVHPDKLGGTRHLSAAQFVYDQHDGPQSCAALVASQDGRFTVFDWSPSENAVHAHRIETLLL